MGSRYGVAVHGMLLARDFYTLGWKWTHEPGSRVEGGEPVLCDYDSNRHLLLEQHSYSTPVQKPKLFIQEKYVTINYNQTSTNKLYFNMISIFHLFVYIDVTQIQLL
jgi:hypothetical protein